MVPGHSRTRLVNTVPWHKLGQHFVVQLIGFGRISILADDAVVLSINQSINQSNY